MAKNKNEDVRAIAEKIRDSKEEPVVKQIGIAYLLAISEGEDKRYPDSAPVFVAHPFSHIQVPPDLPGREDRENRRAFKVAVLGRVESLLTERFGLFFRTVRTRKGRLMRIVSLTPASTSTATPTTEEMLARLGL